MISEYDLERVIKEADPEKLWFQYDKERKMLINKDTGKDIGSLHAYLLVLREETGQSFETIYDEHVSLTWIVKCTKCGCVLFGGDDERYEPSLKCPVCTDYVPHSTKFWTKEDIESDTEKQNAIKFYEDAQIHQVEAYKRRKKRNGKYDWQIWEYTKIFKNSVVKFELECNNITQSYFKGLHLTITFSKGVHKDEGGNIFSWTHGRQFTISLSWSDFYIRHIYRHLGKCHPDMRSKWFIGKPRDVVKS